MSVNAPSKYLKRREFLLGRNSLGVRLTAYPAVRGLSGFAFGRSAPRPRTAGYAVSHRLVNTA
jgi:hypothetical protein